MKRRAREILGLPFWGRHFGPPFCGRAAIALLVRGAVALLSVGEIQEKPVAQARRAAGGVQKTKFSHC